MSLQQIVDNRYTDKDTVHSYLSLYQHLLEPVKDTTKNMLEIGQGSWGGSALMFSKFFTNANIHTVDIHKGDELLNEVRSKDNIVLYNSTNAYNRDFINKEFVEKGLKFEVMLDDGSHQLHDMKTFIELYTPLMTDNAILIIEDVQHISWFKELENSTPEYLNKYIKCYDLRHLKNRWDDLVFTIDKRGFF
jgi:cephalosporin hydroxylase